MLAFGEKGEKAPYAIKLITKAQLAYSLSKFECMKAKDFILAKNTVLVDSKYIHLLFFLLQDSAEN